MLSEQMDQGGSDLLAVLISRDRAEGASAAPYGVRASEPMPSPASVRGPAMTVAALRSPRLSPPGSPPTPGSPPWRARSSRRRCETWAFDAQDLAELRARASQALSRRRADAALEPAGRRSPSAPVLPLAGAAGLGLVGAALVGAAPAQAAPVEFPAWASVTGVVPDAGGLDRQAAQANDWTFSWSTDASGVVTFDYADGTRSTSLDPTARPAVPPGAAGTPGAGELSVQSLNDPLWDADPAQAADPGLDELAAAVSAPFEKTPSGQDSSDQAPGPRSDSADASDQEILSTAAVGLGGQYVWGGTGFKAWDCSAFVQWVYAQHGIEIPRVTWEQFAAAQPTTQPRPGDLVSQNGGSHVGIYLGGDRMISALNPQQGTIEHSVHDMALDGFYTVR